MSKPETEYGGALFALAAEEKLTDALLAEIDAVERLLEENPDYIGLLSCPTVPVGERCAALKKAFAGRVHPYLLSFLSMLTERGYATCIRPCFAEYRRLHREASNVAVGQAESAVALSDEQKEKLIAALSARIGKRVELTYSVNEALLGGVRVTVDGKLFDGTLSAKLAGVRERLRELTL